MEQLRRSRSVAWLATDCLGFQRRRRSGPLHTPEGGGTDQPRAVPPVLLAVRLPPFPIPV